MDDGKKGQEGPGGTALERSEGDEVAGAEREGRAPGTGFAPRGKPRRTASTHRPGSNRGPEFTGEQRLLALDCWFRSELPATEFAPLIGVSSASLYAWRRKFDEEGPAGLLGHKRGMKGSRVPEPVKRAILMMKECASRVGPGPHPRHADPLGRHRGLGGRGAAGADRSGLRAWRRWPAAAQPSQGEALRAHAAQRAVADGSVHVSCLKRERRRLHLVCFMDDFSRFIVGFGVHASASGAMVRESFEAGIANFGAPTEILTDNGAQFHTWRGQERVSQAVREARHPADRGDARGARRRWGRSSASGGRCSGS